MIDKFLLDNANEIIIQCGIDEKIDNFLATIPYIVDILIFSRDLESCWNPDTIHGDVDERDEDGNSYLESHSMLTVGKQD